MHEFDENSVLVASAQASAYFALGCLEKFQGHLRVKSGFVTPQMEAVHWHEFGDLEGPGWAVNAVGGAQLLFRWGKFTGETDLQGAALSVLDHILDFGFIDEENGFIWPYFDISKEQFCWNYAHTDQWLCPGSLAKVGVQLLDFANEIHPDPRSGRMRETAHRLGLWLKNTLPLLLDGWVPRRITPDGKAFPFTPSGQPDPIFDKSSDGLFVLHLWSKLVAADYQNFAKDAEALGTSFVQSGGRFGSINHDTYDEHESVAYACAFRVLCSCADILQHPEWRDFAYRRVLPEINRFLLLDDRHGLPTAGLLWMEESWNTAYLWENAEASHAYLEAWAETGNEQCLQAGLGILLAIARHHHGKCGFLTEGVDWDNQVGRRHHVNGSLFEDIRYTEPFLNNLHHLGPTLFYLQRTGYKEPVLSQTSAIQLVNNLSNGSRPEPGGHSGVKYWLRFYHTALATDERLEQALDFTRRCNADGVLLFEASYDMDPAILTLDQLSKRYERLSLVVPKFRALVAEVHINSMITLGHVDAGSARPERFKFQFLVNEDGVESRSTGCPLDPAFITHIAAQYQMAAETGANVIWVDDDTRLLFHDIPGMACFCPRHIQEYNQYSSQKWHRKSLVQALKVVTNLDLRKSWLDFQENVILDLARIIEASIHAVNPDIRIGLMSVGQSIHAAEGRRTDRLLRALSDVHHAPLLRPGSGFWTDWTPGGVLEKALGCQRELALLGADVCAVAEIENHPYTPFGKSNRIMALELKLNVLAGISILSLNLMSSMGGSGSIEPAGTNYSSFLLSQRPFLDALSIACSGKQRFGVNIIDHVDYARKVKLDGKDLMALVQPRPWEIVLARMGFPIGPFEQGIFDQCGPCWLAGDVIRCLSDYDLMWHLRAGAVLDPVAVQALLERGWGEQFGLIDAVRVNDAVNELLTDDPINGEFPGEVLPIYNHIPPANLFTWILQPGRGRILSTWINVDDLNCGPACVLLEKNEVVFNKEYKQRLMLIPYVIKSPSLVLLNVPRRRQWSTALEWLAKKPLPIQVIGGVNIIPYVFSDDEQSDWVFAMVNLCADDQEVEIQIGSDVKMEGLRMTCLDSEGAWRIWDMNGSRNNKVTLAVEAFSVEVIRAKREN